MSNKKYTGTIRAYDRHKGGLEFHGEVAFDTPEELGRIWDDIEKNSLDPDCGKIDVELEIDQKPEEDLEEYCFKEYFSLTSMWGDPSELTIDQKREEFVRFVAFMTPTDDAEDAILTVNSLIEKARGLQ
jgi:hypothetical protein